MANTLKFGNGQWATKEGSTLAYNDENGNFKPLPFNFERSTSATRVNKEGLIEVVSNNEPRIDFKDDSNGALLLEPSRSNVLPYSNKFLNTGWQYYRGTITANATISPDGTLNASRYQEDSQTGGHLFRRQSLSITNGLSYTGSIFVKKGEYNVVRLASNSTSRWNAGAEFSLENGTVTSGTGVIENYGNGWYRCSISGNAVQTTTAAGFEIYTSVGVGRNGDGLFMYGAMFEQGSYATSYIPTSGQANGVTRVADVCSQTPPSGIIGQTEGSVYVEGNAILDANGSMPFTIYLNSSNIIYAWFRTNGIIDIDVFASGVFQDRIRTSVGTISNGDYFKLSLGYKANDLIAYLNGVQIGTASPSLIPSCTSLIIGGYIASSYSGSSINEAKLYNTRLSNAELQALTTI